MSEINNTSVDERVFGSADRCEHSANDKASVKTFTVTQINEYIKMLIDTSPVLSSLYIKGEISNLTCHKTGHFYFTLKDSGGVIRAVMFRGAASKLKFQPENGMKVIAHGRISAYVRDGQYQIYIDSLEPDGIGALYVAYEQLRRRLEAEGLFRNDIKKQLPKIPTRIGIITSPTGAAVRDMINVTNRRFPYAEIVIFPSLVQGDGAVAQLCEGIHYFNATRRVNVIIIGRGGGSIEDLWAFNDESLARTIRRSEIPVISAVGHETDFTIADFAADRRAPTPSAAAEIAVPDMSELKRKIDNIVGRMELLLSRNVSALRSTIENIASKKIFNDPLFFTDDKRMTVLTFEKSVDSAMKILLSEKRTRFVSATSALRTLNPMSVILRGYSAVFDEDGNLIKSIDHVKVGDKFTLKTADGEIDGRVEDKRISVMSDKIVD